MNEREDAFIQRISNSRRQITERLSETYLRVAILGPNLDDALSVGTRKRHQIATALEKDGHTTFFPEDLVVRDNPFVPWVERERELLRGSDTDLVIILHTEDSAGVLVEIGNFISVPEIYLKTAILFPIQYYKPTQNMSGNTVQGYFTKMNYTQEDLISCELVAECRRWAYTRQKHIWPNLSSGNF